MQTNTIENCSPRKVSLLSLLIRYRIIIILLLLILGFTLANSLFIHPTNLLNMVKRMSFIAITAFGMTYVITTAGLDLSVGSIAAVVGVSLALMLGMGLPLTIAIILCLLISLALGGVNGVVIVKGRIEPFLVTLATMNIFRGLALVLTGGRPVPIVNESFVYYFGNGMLFNKIPIPILIMAVFLALSYFLYAHTKYGFYIRCTGGNIEAANLSGIDVGKVKVATYMLSGLFACISGLILAAMMSSGLPNIANDLALDAISAVILGGTAIVGGYGSILGTLGGTLIMATLNSGMSLLGAQYPEQILVKGIVIIAAVLMDNAFKSRG